jgi:hypothetical protein
MTARPRKTQPLSQDPAETPAVEGVVVDAPKVDDLDVAYKEIAREPYRFRWAGRDWTLPHMGELDYRIQAEIESTTEFTLDKIDTLFRRMFGPEQADAFNETTVTGPFLAMLFDRWLTHSGVTPGEPEASTPSSETTGAKSRPTSGASTSSASPKRSTAKRAPRKAALKAASPPVNSST